MADSMSNGEDSSIFQSIKRCLATTTDLLRSRLEIISTELEEEKIRLVQVAMLSAAALFFFFLGSVMASIFVVAIAWDTDYRLWVAGGMAVLDLAIAGAAGLMIKSKLSKKHRLFATTLSELAKDRRYLSS